MLAETKDVFPRSVQAVMDHMEERSEEPCGWTGPKTILAALAFMGNAGGVPVDDRLSMSTFLLNGVASLTAELAAGKQETKKAPRTLMLLIIALELEIVEGAMPFYY